MIISHILQFVPLVSKPVVPPASIPLTILCHKPHIENYATRAAHQQHRQTCAVSYLIIRALISNEHIGSHDPSGISQPDLHSCCDGALIVACHILS
jgi:hypothetical protein